VFPACRADKGVCVQAFARRKVDSVSGKEVDVCDMYCDFAASDKVKEVVVVIKNAQPGADEHGIGPRFELPGLRVLVVAVDRQDVVSQYTPKCVNDLSSECGAV